MYLLACRTCAGTDWPEDLVRGNHVIPFGSPAERGKWAAEHTSATRHDSWLVLDMPEKTGVCS